VDGPQTKCLSSLQRIVVVPLDLPLRVMLELKVGKVPELVDTGAQFSYVHSHVAEFLYPAREPCDFSLCSMVCLIADRTRSEVTDAVKLHVTLLSFLWVHEFKVLKGGPLPVILGLHFFLRKKQMVVDVASKRFSFGFATSCTGQYCDWQGNIGE
jgi:hypothetical protein